MSWAIELAEQGWIPDSVVRHGIRRLLGRRLREIDSDPVGAPRVAEEMRRGPVAVAADSANDQHYELPPAFFERVLGSRLKYSGCYWPNGVDSLDAAEAAALDLACSRAGIQNGMRVLELGCGWGSLGLWIAEHFPACSVTAVSNSAPQGDFIRGCTAARGLGNLEVVTADVASLRLDATFDRVVSIEMFEHMRNYSLLLERVARWLAPGGRLFVHVFCHRSRPYFFESQDSTDWMARHFFTGGLMPSEHLMEQFSGPVELERRWRINGRHYEKTALAWLANLDRSRDEILKIFEPVYGRQAERWLCRWRMFFLACAELFAYNDGREWFISHSLWSRGAPTTN